MEEQEMIDHFSHEHPLTRIPNFADINLKRYWCNGCGRYFLHGDAGYECRAVNCSIYFSLHEECGEMPREIMHPVHPSHPLTQAYPISTNCAICEEHSSYIGYKCSQGCKLWIHLGCAGGFVAADEQVMNHPSHPEHELRFLRRKNRSCSFECDACGTTQRGNSYICSICQYWIHESCATLPTSTAFQNHPDHSLTLAYTPPLEYIKYNYACDICSGSLQLKHWVYHCKLCRYVVHIKCATNKSLAATSNSMKNQNAADDDILKGPMNDIYEELIKPFVKRERGKISIPHIDNEISTTYKFLHHHHPLSFISFSSLPSSHNQISEGEEDDHVEDETSELTCDGCTLPILQKTQNPSTSYLFEYDIGYMSCDKCTYFLHLSCFNLPHRLRSHHLHQIKHHHLKLKKSDKLISTVSGCSICYFYTNGLFYDCNKCDFQIDIKCVSLTDTIKHEGHPKHDLMLVTGQGRICFVCGDECAYCTYYRCDKCTFLVCCGCVLLPASNKHRLENHMLPLTFDASANHPDEFYCANCEGKINPKCWMYHCRQCDQSFHPKCIPSSGCWRNFNFGKKLYHTKHHPQHPLRFRVISNKKRCDLCHLEVYDEMGYQCISCNFVVCRWHKTVKPVD